MKKNAELYDALDKILKEKKCTFEEIVDGIKREGCTDFKLGTLRTILYRKIAKGTVVHNDNLYWKNDENILIKAGKKEERNEKEKNENSQLMEYINSLLIIIDNKEKELLKNPFEQFESEDKWIEARKIYQFNKKIKKDINKELESLKKSE